MWNLDIHYRHEYYRHEGSKELFRKIKGIRGKEREGKR
jgi:hypothetical protein